jgi:hypothetical protein
MFPAGDKCDNLPVEISGNVMQRIKNALRNQWFWACQNKPFWVNVLLLSLTVVFVAIQPAKVNGTPTDLPVRFWGMCLQLIGAYTVWMDMTKTAKDYGLESKTWEWLKRIFTPARTVNGAANIVLDGVSCTATGSVRTLANPNDPVDKRVSLLEKQMTIVRDQLDTVRHDIAIHKNELTTDIRKRAAELQQQLSTLETQLKDALVGNYAVLNLGAFWLVVGIILSSVAVELTNFFHANWQIPRFW